MISTAKFYYSWHCEYQNVGRSYLFAYFCADLFFYRECYVFTQCVCSTLKMTCMQNNSSWNVFSEIKFNSTNWTKLNDSFKNWEHFWRKRFWSKFSIACVWIKLIRWNVSSTAERATHSSTKKYSEVKQFWVIFDWAFICKLEWTD